MADSYKRTPVGFKGNLSLSLSLSLDALFRRGSKKWVSLFECAHFSAVLKRNRKETRHFGAIPSKNTHPNGGLVEVTKVQFLFDRRLRFLGLGGGGFGSSPGLAGDVVGFLRQGAGNVGGTWSPFGPPEKQTVGIVD